MSDTAILDPVASEASWDDQVAAISEALKEPTWLRELRLPTLVAHGDHDTVVPFEYGQIFAQRIPQAEFRAFPGAGHGLFSLPEV